MSHAFHRFPHTPHLAWLGEGTPRADKVLDAQAAGDFLAHLVVIEEKIDGANLGLSVDDEGDLRAQNRGSWLSPEAAHPQFRTLWSWLAPRRDALIDALWPDLILYGEWCYAVHSVRYDALPDWFLGFDVFDQTARRFWSAPRRDALLAELGLHSVPSLGSGRFSIDDMVQRMSASHVGSAPMEGVYVRRESSDWLESRAKLVRAEFVQAIDTHWSRGPLERNRLAAMSYHNPPTMNAPKR